MKIYTIVITTRTKKAMTITTKEVNVKIKNHPFSRRKFSKILKKFIRK